MIVSFYDKDFEPIVNNTGLKIDKESYKLIKRPIELNELSCTCKAFDADIQPMFLVISDERDRYVYGSLAGVPVLNNDNKTEINGTDIKSILSSDVILNQPGGFIYVAQAIDYIFNQWNNQVNQNSFDCELVLTDNDLAYVEIEDYEARYPNGLYNALEEIQNLMRYYKMYMETQIDVVNKKIVFIIGQTMVSDSRNVAYDPTNIKLWEYGIKNYGKVVADINECQGYVVISEDKEADQSHPEAYTIDHWFTRYNGVDTIRWILTSSGDITDDPTKRDIYPIKRRIVTSSENMYEANKLALETLLEKQYNEDIELPATQIKPKFETLFNVYTHKDGDLYKQLPCGELQYDESGLVKFKIGYRYTGVNFI